MRMFQIGVWMVGVALIALILLTGKRVPRKYVWMIFITCWTGVLFIIYGYPEWYAGLE